MPIYLWLSKKKYTMTVSNTNWILKTHLTQRTSLRGAKASLVRRLRQSNPTKSFFISAFLKSGWYHTINKYNYNSSLKSSRYLLALIRINYCVNKGSGKIYPSRRLNVLVAKFSCTGYIYALYHIYNTKSKVYKCDISRHFYATIATVHNIKTLPTNHLTKNAPLQNKWDILNNQKRSPKAPSK